MLRYDPDSYAERALAILEKDVRYLAWMNWGYGMSPEDVAQELRIHLWNKLHLYHPGKAELRTWGQRVMRMKLIDMHRNAEYGRDTGIPRNMLDSEYREHYPDLGDKEAAAVWVLEEEITIQTF